MYFASSRSDVTATDASRENILYRASLGLYMKPVVSSVTGAAGGAGLSLEEATRHE